MTSHKLAHAYFVSVAIVLVHAHCAYTRILHSHYTVITSQCKSAWTNSRVRQWFRDVRAMCSREVTSDIHSVLKCYVVEVWRHTIAHTRISSALVRALIVSIRAFTIAITRDCFTMQKCVNQFAGASWFWGVRVMWSREVTSWLLQCIEQNFDWAK